MSTLLEYFGVDYSSLPVELQGILAIVVFIFVFSFLFDLICVFLGRFMK